MTYIDNNYDGSKEKVKSRAEQVKETRFSPRPRKKVDPLAWALFSAPPREGGPANTEQRLRKRQQLQDCADPISFPVHWLERSSFSFPK